MTITETTVRSILTRTGGYLSTVASHSLQPYRGCSYGRSLCGTGCYVRHARHLLRGRAWGEFLEVRTNAAAAYRENYRRELNWARRSAAGTGQRMVLFCSSATDPFVPQEQRYGITRSLLEAMCDLPPDELILQTHSHQVAGEIERLRRLAGHTVLRVHLSIETDRDRLPGLPPPASSVARRLQACATLKAAGVRTVVTVAPLLPITDPPAFFSRIAEVADAVVLDHFIGGDGSAAGQRTLRTDLPAAMEAVLPRSLSLAYRDEMLTVAKAILPGRVGVGADGFAGRFDPATAAAAATAAAENPSASREERRPD